MFTSLEKAPGTKPGSPEQPVCDDVTPVVAAQPLLGVTALATSSLIAGCGGGADADTGVAQLTQGPAIRQPLLRQPLASAVRAPARAWRNPTPDEFFAWAEQTHKTYFPGQLPTLVQGRSVLPWPLHHRKLCWDSGGQCLGSGARHRKCGDQCGHPGRFCLCCLGQQSARDNARGRTFSGSGRIRWSDGRPVNGTNPRV